MRISESSPIAGRNDRWLRLRRRPRIDALVDNVLMSWVDELRCAWRGPLPVAFGDEERPAWKLMREASDQKSVVNYFANVELLGLRQHVRIWWEDEDLSRVHVPVVTGILLQPNVSVAFENEHLVPRFAVRFPYPGKAADRARSDAG